MSDKKIKMPLEEIMGERFGRYSKYIIQDRALPDVRDGLKPVQRRILYAMFKEGNTHNKAYRKSAKTVGNVIGNYHPHGDSSVYEAMVRMSQEWKMRVPLVDMQGNNGSIDNDPAAAMRYTEARLSPIALEILQDIDKETVSMTLNFDDTEYEPTVLPAKYPNILVNGATGISAGYATDIPPHNFEEVIDATIHRINKPNSTLEDIMEFIKGPDFPTGAIVEGKDGIVNAFKTGRGKVVVRSKINIVSEKNMHVIVVDEIPYEVNKADLVRKMDDIRFNKSIDGIIEVRDESDRTGLRIVVEVKKDANVNNILNYLYKNTDLQKNYNYNVVAIKNKRPKLMGLLEILDAYIEHQVDVITKRSTYLLAKANARQHIVEGLIKAISILDHVVKTIRNSSDKGDAKRNLIAAYDFSEQQAEAIVMLQLYRLTNTDIVELEIEHNELSLKINELNAILNDKKVLNKLIVKELKETKAKFKIPRLSEIKDEITETTINKDELIVPEEVYVSVTRDGYVKRISPRSYKASDKTPFGKKEDDILLDVVQTNTVEKLLLFTNQGNYMYIPINMLEEFKWKDVGKHISYLVKLNNDEKIIKSIFIKSFNVDTYIGCVSKNGQIKKSLVKDFEVTRFTKTIKCINLKADDELVDVACIKPNDGIIVVSKKGNAVLYGEDSINLLGVKAGGIKGINVTGDEVVSLNSFDPSQRLSLMVFSDKAYVKKLKLIDVEASSRTSRGMPLFKKVKSNEHEIVAGIITLDSNELTVINSNYDVMTINPGDYRYTAVDTRLTTQLDISNIKYVVNKESIIVDNVTAKITKKPVVKLSETTLLDF